jgi:hypothetical protein
MTMRQITAFLLFTFVIAALPSSPERASAQTVKCYRKKCLEYPDGYSICTLTPVDCDEIEIL